MNKIAIITSFLIFHIAAHVHDAMFLDQEHFTTSLDAGSPINCEEIKRELDPKKPEEYTSKDIEGYVIKTTCQPEDIRCINSEEIAHKVAGIMSACKPVSKEIPLNKETLIMPTNRRL
jgi:hypothetical protein